MNWKKVTDSLLDDADDAFSRAAVSSERGQESVAEAASTEANILYALHAALEEGMEDLND